MTHKALEALDRVLHQVPNNGMTHARDLMRDYQIIKNALSQSVEGMLASLPEGTTTISLYPPFKKRKWACLIVGEIEPLNGTGPTPAEAIRKAMDAK